MIRFAAIVVFSLFHLATFAVTAGAGEAPSATPYSGDIWNRSTLTGDWGGLRNQLAEKGVTLDLSVTQIGQGVVERRQERRVAVRRARRHHFELRQPKTWFVARRVSEPRSRGQLGVGG